MDNSAGWGSYPLVNAYIWIIFGVLIGVGTSPWSAVAYAVWAMALNIIVRKVAVSIKHSKNAVRSVDDAGKLDNTDALVEDFGGLSGDTVVMGNNDKV